jgi:hypothetical protein
MTHRRRSERLLVGARFGMDAEPLKTQSLRLGA